MKYISLLVALCAMFGSEAFGQPLDRVQVFGRYTQASQLHDGVTSAGGSGLAVRVDLPLINQIGIQFTLGYDRLAIQQTEMIDRWDWFYWRQIYRHQVQTLQQEVVVVDGVPIQIYEAHIQPIQHAALMSAMLMPAITFTTGNLDVQLAAGGSGIRFVRVMFLDETWIKRFPEIEYEYTYSFRNYAEDKVGYLWSLDAGLNLNYRLSTLFSVGAGVHYRSVMGAHEDFPINNLISGQIGVAVSY